jgi:hypothetical protein
VAVPDEPLPVPEVAPLVVVVPDEPLVVVVPDDPLAVAAPLLPLAVVAPLSAPELAPLPPVTSPEPSAC